MQRRPYSTRFYVAVSFFAFSFCVLFALGTWQVERRTRKLDLIERVDQRVHAAPVAAPAAAEWPQVNAANAEYRHVEVSGRFLHQSATLVQASTELGPGFWVLTPLRQEDGNIVLINRGFIPTEQHLSPQETSPLLHISGLLRISEPGGSALRKNEPAANRWFSRDVQAIAAARGLDQVAPYFIDADAAPSPVAGEPVGGLTVISFYNHHLVYIFTWYTLALMAAGAIAYLFHSERKRES
ncbi:MAG TPA: SURF1 family protein [Rhodocyclaceae bacterium]|jgi:surfeit locus 1 family protein|nr:SURF1 family protein [Rhodocyclaceae bacterium]